MTGECQIVFAGGTRAEAPAIRADGILAAGRHALQQPLRPGRHPLTVRVGASHDQFLTDLQGHGSRSHVNRDR
jgi:hypothetical protein